MNKNSWGRQVDKNTLLGKKEIGKVNQTNNLGSKISSKPKTFRLEGGVVPASLRVINSENILLETEIHPLNPRNQDALDDISVKNTLESISKNGIDTDCLGIWSDDESKILIIEGSVRRYCAIKTEQCYPIWVLPAKSATNKDIRRLIADASDKKKHSLRERGEAYWKEALELTDKIDSMTNEELSELLSVGRETLRKALQAFHIDMRLLKILPDYEGVQNAIYPKLAKIEKHLKKNSVSIDLFIQEVESSPELNNIKEMENTVDIQQQILTVMEALAFKARLKKTSKWHTNDLVQFEQKNKFARKSISANGESVRFEFGRINSDLIEDIEELIMRKLQ
ncbi:ParB [Vibrio ichthyoenteri ATCC 700023]|uniref:ParB n=1 Tax=Vibrio ichthyoenteri ATCC 700023 TaxID=870968 RepID=F9RXX8_9VIBR|nr:ParB family protein [Vibrio ichthyoenteri]EGU47178.1 ParB [Vibrio ichthyoenteri ATCC 700023]